MSRESRKKRLTPEEKELWAATQEGIPIERVRAYLQLAEIEQDRYKFKDAAAIYEIAIEILEAESEIDYAPEQAQALYEMAGCLSLSYEFEQELEVIKKALDFAEKSGFGDVPSLLRAAGRSLHALNDDENSIKYHQRAYEYPNPEISEEELAIDQLNIGMSLKKLERYQEAIEKIQFARGSFKKLKEPKWVAICDGELTEIYIGLNDGVSVEKYAQLALGTAEMIEDRYRQWWLQYYLGIAKRLQGDLDSSLKNLESGRSLALAFGCDEFKYLVKVDLEIAGIYVIKGMVKQAEEIERRARNVESILEAA